MLPQFLIPEATVREAGAGPGLNLGDPEGETLLLTLGITHVIEQESIDVSIWGSRDGQDWGSKPLLTFPQKFYCGTYKILLDLADKPDIRYIRAQWQLRRWGKGDPKPRFAVYLFAQQTNRQLMAAGG
jgi:hypothetical protein